jgi:hypothetical protein
MLETIGIVITIAVITNVVWWLLYTPKVQPHEIDLLRAEIIKVDLKIHELASYIEFQTPEGLLDIQINLRKARQKMQESDDYANGIRVARIRRLRPMEKSSVENSVITFLG